MISRNLAFEKNLFSPSVAQKNKNDLNTSTISASLFIYIKRIHIPRHYLVPMMALHKNSSEIFFRLLLFLFINEVNLYRPFMSYIPIECCNNCQIISCSRQHLGIPYFSEVRFCLNKVLRSYPKYIRHYKNLTVATCNIKPEIKRITCLWLVTNNILFFSMLLSNETKNL